MYIEYILVCFSPLGYERISSPKNGNSVSISNIKEDITVKVNEVQTRVIIIN